jgi:competence protein ComEA
MFGEWSFLVHKSSRDRGIMSVMALAALSTCLNASAEPPTSNAHVAGVTPFAKGPDQELVVRVCTPCHAPEQVIAKHRTADEWDAIIGRMLDRGAQANEPEQDRILTYLVRFYGP